MKQLISQHVPQKIKNGYHLLKAIYANNRYGNPSKGLVVCGITGTDGKTTTANYLYHLLKHAGYRVALISTVGAYFDDHKEELGFHVTTPDALQLQALIRRIKDQDITHLVLEATSHGLDQNRLYGIDVDYAIYTNITPEHLDYHGTFKRYVAAKAKLACKAKHIIYNQPHPSTQQLKPHFPQAASLHPYDSSQSQHGWLQKYITQDYNRQNMVAAITTAQLIGVSQASIKQALPSVPQIEGRLESIPNQRGIDVIVDFAHTPNALKQALKQIKQAAQGKVIAVFGAAGLRDYHKRPRMGVIATKHADYVVLTAEDPRTENVYSIMHQIKSGIHDQLHKVISIPDRQQAIDYAINTLAHNNDTVAIFGKGHEKSMNLDGTTEIPWSDHQAAHQALEQAHD